MVQRRYPSSELLAAGWSLGGNILVRYLGEEGHNCPISAAASLCNPLDLVSNPFNLLHCPSGNGIDAGGPNLTICVATSTASRSTWILTGLHLRPVLAAHVLFLCHMSFLIMQDPGQTTPQPWPAKPRAPCQE